MPAWDDAVLAAMAVPETETTTATQRDETGFEERVPDLSEPFLDIGLRKDISVTARAAVLRAAIAFRDNVVLADKWEQTKGE